MKTLKLFALSLLFTIFSANVLAQAQQIGTVDQLVVHWNGSDISKFDISLTGETVDPTSECDTGRFSGDLTSEAGKAQYSLILSAHVSGQRLHITGQGSCGFGNELLRNVVLLF